MNLCERSGFQGLGVFIKSQGRCPRDKYSPTGLKSGGNQIRQAQPTVTGQQQRQLLFGKIDGALASGIAAGTEPAIAAFPF
jgi:hypothetical protein